MAQLTINGVAVKPPKSFMGYDDSGRNKSAFTCCII